MDAQPAAAPGSARAVPRADITGLVSYLATRLPPAPAPVLTVGSVPGEPALGADRPGSVRVASALDQVPSAAFPAVLWRPSGEAAELAAGTAKLPVLLGTAGKLFVVARVTAAYDELAPHHERAYRELVRRLSEGAFAIVEERNLVVSGEEACWRLLVARPDAFRVRSYQPGDEASIQRMFGPCFHVQRSDELWRWKYQENPWGGERISLAFAPDGELAAQYAGYPIPLWRGDRRGQETLLAVQLGDTMTSPVYRHVGRRRSSLLARTVRHFFAVRRDGSIGFYYGAPIVPHQRFCEWFIGAHILEPAPLWVGEVATLPVPGRGVRVSRHAAVPAAADRFFRRVAGDYGLLVERSRRYLDWRYVRCPGVDYVLLAASRWGRMVGWSVFRRDGERLLWGDALFAPRHVLPAASSLLAAALALPEHAGVRRIEGWFSPRPAWWHEALPVLGFVPRDEPNRLALTAFSDAGPGCEELRRRWYYTWGDFDLF